MALDALSDPSSTDLSQDRTELAGMRTAMGAERTLMAWIRTSLSMLSFGFTIYKVLEGFEQAAGHGTNAPRNAGLVLSALGTLAMALGTREYWLTVRALREFRSQHVARFPLIMAAVMSAGGIFLFFSILVRLF